MSADMSDEDAGPLSAGDWQIHDAPSPADSAKSETEVDEKMTDNGADAESSSQPIQKRRRVTRACDECRRKKIKCDGKQPCTHCSVYSYGMLMQPEIGALDLPFFSLGLLDDFEFPLRL